jgi:hypothetical protein
VGARFSAPVLTGSEAHPASYTMGTGISPGVKRPGRGVDHPPLSSAEVNDRAIPLLPLWAFVVCSRVNFILVCSPKEVVLYFFFFALNTRYVFGNNHRIYTYIASRSVM